MSSNPADILHWVQFRFDIPVMTHANGVFVMAIPCLGGIVLGIGSSKAQAIYDLYCQIVTAPSLRTFTRPPNARRWELERRKRIDQEFLKQRVGVKKS